MLELTAENFKSTISKGKTIVDFWAPWCGPCRMFAPIYEATSKEYPDIAFAKLNTDEHQQIAAELGIRGIPTMIFFQEGQELGRVSGAMPKPMFEQKIREMYR